VRVGSIDALPPQPRFDAAVLLDVLEHVPDPLPFLRALHARLRPGGRLLIMTPNLASWLARVSGARWVSLKVPEHVLYYTPQSLRRVLANAGFAVRTLRPAGQYVTLAFLLERTGRLAPAFARPLGALVRMLGRERAVVYVSNGSIDVVAQTMPSAI
jgi:SAM-dependent methyltransferase